jgi:hypothetical protein
MFGIGRLFKAIGLGISGMFTGWRKKINRNPLIVQATFDEAADKAENDRAGLRAGIADKLRIVEGKKKEISKLQEQLDGEKGHRKVLIGIEIAIKQRGEALRQKNGGSLTAEIVAADSEPTKGLIALRARHELEKDKINKAEQRVAKLKGETATSDADLARHENNLVRLKDQATSLREEGATRVAELIANRAERAADDRLSGFSTTDTDKQLREIRELCESDGIETNISRRLAQAEGPGASDNFLDLAEQQGANTDFDALLNLTPPTAATASVVPEKLPE